ncbi:hypothetical protein [Desulfobacter vibrioformis]|uniref:hypothetical protein n=1 Tax=Desulfobacter vibrioformis TaxID=34031 RepID=UPI0005584768|nr:hypothetical protein [Desulfobacter vibrioformis]
MDNAIIHENYNKLSKERKNTLVNRSLFTKRWINNGKHEYFLDQYVRFLVNNLVFGMLKECNIRCSRSNTYYKTSEISNKDRYYKAMGLKYEPFLMIVDILELLGLITQTIGSQENGKESTIAFSEKGLKMFEYLRNKDIRFKKLSCIVDNEKKNYNNKSVDPKLNSELVVLNDTVLRLITKGKNKGKYKKVSVPVDFEIKP